MRLLTVRRLRKLLKKLDGPAPVRVVLVGEEDAYKLLAAVGAHAPGEPIFIKVPSPLHAVQALEANDGSALILAFCPEE